MGGGVTASSLMGKSAPKAAKLTFSMGVGAGKIVDALTAVEGVTADVLEDFKEQLLSGIGDSGFSKGDVMTLEWCSDGKSSLAVTAKGKLIYNKVSPALAKGLLELYLGKKAVSPGLVKSIEQ